ncbi:MAG TPA: M4 family metallopeptidase [Bryobacteraceae bacterium]|nr:M4 family metallopeptidase [Bryobacteraceae bacterium]
MHSLDETARPMMSKLREESATAPSFGMWGTASLTQVDPETVARNYLEQALASASVPSFSAPTVATVPSEFKSLGTETIPLTGTRTVKFRQTFNNIPVFGSLVTVELDPNNDLVSMNSSMGAPEEVDPVAKISAAQALKAIEKHGGFRKNLEDVVPRLHYYFDSAASKWRLVFVAESVRVTPVGTTKKLKVHTPSLMDYIVDAHTGAVVAEMPATHTMAAVVETAVDNVGKPRTIRIEQNGNNKVLFDRQLNVQTFDFNFRDPVTEATSLPGKEIKNPPKWSPSAVSAHANAATVAEFLRDVLRRNNIDNRGGAMKSTINCVDKRDSPDGKQWFNAFWNGAQMVYGQRVNGTEVTSLAANIDVVAHEMFHGVTDHSADLVYQFQPGALNESYSDIFGIIISNLDKPDPRNWDWELGEGLAKDGRPFRDLRDPARFNQPDHMQKFKVLPNTPKGDWGGVHINSGIHNRVLHLILTSVDSTKKLLFTPNEVAAVFYLALTQQLSRTSQFSDSRRAVLISARTLFRTLPPMQQQAKLKAIAKAFTDVGIEDA